MLPAIDSGGKTLPLITLASRCWDGRVGEHETLPLITEMTQEFSERQLKHALAFLLNEISRYGRQRGHESRSQP